MASLIINKFYNLKHTLKLLLKEIYILIPFKLQLYTLLKKIYHPPKKLYQHLHFIGDFSVAIEKNKHFRIRHYGYQVENEIFWNGLFGGWEKCSLALWRDLCKNSNIVFDIGANTGVYALLAKSINKQAKVFAFEPVQRVFNKLEHNIRLNSFDIKCIQKALSNYDGKAVIYDTDSEHTYSVTVNKMMNPEGINSIPVEIETMKLDTFIKETGIGDIDLMKIDVETHEAQVLEGFKEHIQQFRPTLLIEILDNEVARSVESVISGMGYVYFSIDEAKGICKVAELSKGEYRNFIICREDVAESLQYFNEENGYVTSSTNKEIKYE